MEPYGGVPVFVDVDLERAPGRFIITQDLCHNGNTQGEDDASTSEIQDLDQRASLPIQQNQSMSSRDQAATSNEEIQPMTAQNDVGGRLEVAKSKPSGSKKTASDRTEEAGLAPVPRRIRCPECQRYTAENEEKMIRHIKKVHKGENPFECYMCDYSTYNKNLFEEHVRIHQGIKPFKCTQCDYKSASKKNLKKHELIHRPNNP